MRLALPGLLVLSFALAPALAQEAAPAGAPAPIDVLKVTPADLRGPDVRALVAQAMKAYHEERYEDAARAYIEALRGQPEDSGSLYNLACCYGLMGAAEQAAAFVGAAFDAGFFDLGHIRRDPDFDKVRESEAFQAELARMTEKEEESRSERGRLLAVETGVIMPVRVVPPDDYEEGRRYPLVIGLHGYGDNAENFAPLFRRRGMAQPFLFVVPEAPYPSHSGRKVGYSWSFPTPFFPGDGIPGTDITRGAELTRGYVLGVLDRVRKAYRVDERNVFLMGFSQGAGLAFSLGLRHPDLFRGVIPIGGWVDPGEFAEDDLKKAAKRGRFLVCHSPDDRMVPWSAAKNSTAFLTGAGVPMKLVSYEGGHSLPKKLMEQVLAWIANPEAGRAEAGGKAE